MKKVNWFGISIACLVFIILCIASGGLWPLIVGVCKFITVIIMLCVAIFAIFIIIHVITMPF